MRVLIVEDDLALGLFLQKGLMLEGHDVEWLADGQAALDRIQHETLDLMVLDLNLPKRDGTEVLEAILGRANRMAILVLTGRNDIEVRVRCLNLGADDCMLKPFSFHELRARCRALLRRREQFADPVLRCSGVELDRMAHRVQRDGIPVELTAKEFTLLEFLLQHQGICCTREVLLREVWQMAPGTGTNVVDVYVNYLRRKLAAVHSDGDEAPTLIETIRGIGYLLGAPVERTRCHPPRRAPQRVTPLHLVTISAEV
jgi:DNA-binding response OmpR family regulator